MIYATETWLVKKGNKNRLVISRYENVLMNEELERLSCRQLEREGTVRRTARVGYQVYINLDF